MADRALVFDFGTRRIGVASANRFAQTTTMLATLSARDGRPAWEQIAALIVDWQPEVLVVGVPRNADGTESDMTVRARSFAAWLTRQSGLATEEVDERFTSVEAEGMLRDQRRAGSRTRRIRPEDIDRMAAALIAQTWLRSAPVP
ncbi:MAG: Holliday junction resolvase RuvX [Gammaproteobacteria bacterium]|nr:MAG: Holliday junction resolvase RuvX [Gammaproteobacteria bacterium]